MPYTPGVVLWSDGAEKQRYLSLPPGRRSTRPTWTRGSSRSAPRRGRSSASTASWSRRACSGSRPSTTLVFATYIWDARQTNAPLNTSTQADVYSRAATRSRRAKDCGKCHHGGADKLLGVEAVALALPTAQGRHAREPGRRRTAEQPAGQDVDHAARRRHRQGRRPRSAICTPTAACRAIRRAASATRPSCCCACAPTSSGRSHDGRDAGAASDSTFTDLTQTDTYRATVNQKPTTASVAAKFPDALRITPGAHDKSLVWLLAHRRGDYQMPPLVSHKSTTSARRSSPTGSTRCEREQHEASRPAHRPTSLASCRT